MKIDFGQNNRYMEFTYNTYGSLIQIKANDQDTYYIFEISYTNNKISSVTDKGYSSDGVMNYDDGITQFSFSEGMTYIYYGEDDGSGDRIYTNSSNKIYKISSGEKSGSSSYEYYESLLTWLNDNITKITHSSEWGLNGEIEQQNEVLTYQFDDRKNPYSLFEPEIQEFLFYMAEGYEWYDPDEADYYSINNIVNKFKDGALWDSRTLTYNSYGYLSTIEVPPTLNYPRITVSFEYSK